MLNRNAQLIFSPCDLITYFRSPYASWRDRLRHEGLTNEEPDRSAPEDQLTARLGDEHERRVLVVLRERGEVWDGSAVKRLGFEEAYAASTAAIKAGLPTLFQVSLRGGRFEGHADFLHRVEVPSSLGGFSYEVVDTKLARTPKPYFLVQLCAYADMLEQLQGVRPPRIGIVTGDGQSHWFRTNDYFDFYLALKEEFLAFHDRFLPDRPPEIDPSADHGRWQSYAEKELAAKDDLWFVAGLTQAQRRKLMDAGVRTTKELAAFSGGSVRGIQPHVFHRLQTQARLQVQSAGEARPKFETKRHDPGVRRGLALLPPPSLNDFFFDLEGYPFEEGGLEYLFGFVHRGQFECLWAHDRQAERKIFEAFIDRVVEARKQDPTMHVYHYGDYERAAIGRLMGRYGTREEEVDDLLRGEVFINLYRVVHQGLQIGTPSYSIKYVERLYLEAREGEVKTATESVVEYAQFLETRDLDPPGATQILDGIRRYNEDDCRSTAALTSWLQAQQNAAGLAWVAPTPQEQRPVDPTKPTTQAERLAVEMLESPSAHARASAELQAVNELLAHLLTFHQREDRPAWWRRFERSALSHEELTEDHDCLGGLRRTSAPPEPSKKSMLYEYAFDAEQESKLAVGDRCIIAGTRWDRVMIERLDPDAGTIVLRFGPKAQVPETCSLIPDDIVPPGTIVESLLATALGWHQHGRLQSSIHTLLRRTRPQFRDRPVGGTILPPDRPLVEGLTDRIANLDRSVLAVQGPPGTGKTHTAAAVIAEMLRAGKRIGIASNSHAAIDKLLKESLKAARLRGVKHAAVKLGEEAAGCDVECLPQITNLDLASTPGPLLVGGTAWAFSHAHVRGYFDLLFIDEAGQVSLANAVAMAPAAQSLVLLGDQLQLDQPIQGTHPGESGQSVLSYLLKGQTTVPPDVGVFLQETHRLHPDLCTLISDAIYEGRLTANTANARRVVKARPGDGLMTSESGLVFVPVEHHGNLRESEEEVAVMVDLTKRLVGRVRTNQRGEELPPICPDDILIVAPYNAQVRLLRRALPDFRSGTVDKFQGQEAQVVIVSMATSAGVEPTRGLEFLFSPNRLNVALSRAQSLAFLVADPRHARARVASVGQMSLVSLFGRFCGPA